jgi:heme A synthase
MKAGPLVFRVTAVAVFLQLLLGGLLTFDFVSAAPHIILGFLVFILAIAAMALAWTSKPAFKPLKGMSVALVVLIIIQIILGYSTLDTGDAFVAWVHFVNALAIYGIAVSAAFMSMRWERMARMGNVPQGAEKPPG